MKTSGSSLSHSLFSASDFSVCNMLKCCRYSLSFSRLVDYKCIFLTKKCLLF